MVQTEKTNMIFCTCGTEAIGMDYDEEDDTTSLAFWQLGEYNYRLGWRERLRWIIQIVKGKRPFTDMVILDKKERSNLIEALQEHTLEVESIILTTCTGDE